MQHLQREKLVKKLVSASKSIISNQIALPYGAFKICRLIYRINAIEPISNLDIQVFTDYDKVTQIFSVGPERLLYNKEFLKLQDKKLDKITSAFKDKIIDKCFEIIQKLDN